MQESGGHDEETVGRKVNTSARTVPSLVTVWYIRGAACVKKDACTWTTPLFLCQCSGGV